MKFLEQEQDGESQWIPISDLMSVLMMVFLLIAISYMIKVSSDKERIEEVAVTYNKLQIQLYEDLMNEFEKDLEDWGAEIDRSTLSVKFTTKSINPEDILFGQGSAYIEPLFKKRLLNFFPRFIQILSKEEYKDDIDEIRIEGHTSTEWTTKVTEQESYILNMKLSQDRTRNVLDFVLRNSSLESSLVGWTKDKLTANGLSSSKVIRDQGGTENKVSSRRVEFRVRTNAESRITKIISEL